LAGETEIESSTGGMTARTVEVATEPSCALIEELPIAIELASPVLLIVAIAGADELHETALVMFCVVPSV
jgi:hypothetical protein